MTPRQDIAAATQLQVVRAGWDDPAQDVRGTVALRRLLEPRARDGRSVDRLHVHLGLRAVRAVDRDADPSSDGERHVERGRAAGFDGDLRVPGEA